MQIYKVVYYYRKGVVTLAPYHSKEDAIRNTLNNASNMFLEAAMLCQYPLCLVVIDATENTALALRGALPEITLIEKLKRVDEELKSYYNNCYEKPAVCVSPHFTPKKDPPMNGEEYAIILRED